MTTWGLLTSTWNWEPTVVAGSALLLLEYLIVFVRWYREPDEDAGPGAGAGEEARA